MSKDTKKVDVENLKAQNAKLDDAELYKELDSETQEKRNPFIKDPVAYAAYRKRRAKNRLI